MKARLHVMLGAGGVGKTTLAAGLALALARDPGRRVGLLGIDPSRRLQDALGVPLGDMDAPVAPVARAAAPRAAVLRPADCLRRWATEACPDSRVRESLFRNTFFLALADRLATATDIFAAVRVAEWLEHDPALTDLVVDTAPGLNAIEFLTRPERVAALLEGRLVGWLRWLARGQAAAERVGGGARRIVGGLGRIAGSQTLGDLAEFFALMDGVLTKMLARVEVTRRWLRDDSTQLLLVASVRQDEARLTEELTRALSGAGLAPHAVIVNRVLPASLAGFEAPLAAIAAHDASAAPVIRYALAYSSIQANVVERVRRLAPRTVLVPGARGLDGEGRLACMAEVGELIRAGLDHPGA